MNSSSLPLQPLTGVIERITFYNEENGYTVARFVPEGKSYTVTVIGNLMGASVGESLALQGIWTNHPNHGRQFEIKKFTIQLPATIEGIRKYLGSGLIKGVGPMAATAGRRGNRRRFGVQERPPPRRQGRSRPTTLLQWG